MMKNSLFIFLLFLSVKSYSKCQVEDFEFTAHIDQMTFDDAYLSGDSLFRVKDFIEVKDLKNLKTYKFDLGTIEDDQSGNFNIQAICTQDATYFNVFHDHETWHKGLVGSFSLPNGKIIDLMQVKDCSFNQLFKLK